MELATGTVIKSHGIRGDLVVDVRTDSPDERFAVGTTITLRLTSGVTSHHEVTAARWHQDRLLIHLADINDRTAADALRRADIIIDSDELVNADNPVEDEYHVTSLIGLEVVTVGGEKLGEVTDVLPYTAQDLLSITDAEERTHLVPFVTAMVPEVDVAAGRLIVDLPEGLWELP